MLGSSWFSGDDGRAGKGQFDITFGITYDTTVIRAVLDTNVLIAALRSSSGASHQLLLAADRGDFELALSVPLLAEYDDVCSRPGSGIPIPARAVDAIIARLAMVAHRQPIFFLWRPLLPDPKDDMVLELAVAAGVSHFITFNQQDLLPAATFGIAVVTPAQFIQLLP
jgi:predicted nucleic acid-binding protein